MSGGSIAAGAVISALAEGDFSSLLDFDRRVTTKLINLGQCNFRRRIMTKASWLAYLLPYLPKLQQLALAAALRPKMSKAFPQVLDEELFEGRKMKQAEAATEWSCNATCINTIKKISGLKRVIFTVICWGAAVISTISPLLLPLRLRLLIR